MELAEGSFSRNKQEVVVLIMGSRPGYLLKYVVDAETLLDKLLDKRPFEGYYGNKYQGLRVVLG